LAKLATLPEEEEYQDLDIGGFSKIANFANSLSPGDLPRSLGNLILLGGAPMWHAFSPWRQSSSWRAL
jgi:hypothetical protein